MVFVGVPIESKSSGVTSSVTSPARLALSPRGGRPTLAGAPLQGRT